MEATPPQGLGTKQVRDAVLDQQAADKYGYTGYLIAILMPEPVRQAVGKVRERLDIPMLTMPAHVTLKGTFVQPRSLDTVHAIVSSVARKTRPFTICLADEMVWGKENARTLVISVPSSPELDNLHIKLYEAIELISTNVYGRTGQEPVKDFRFHVTIYQGADEANHQVGMGLVSGLNLPESVEVKCLQVLGRVAALGKGHHWRVIQEYPFRWE